MAAGHRTGISTSGRCPLSSRSEAKVWMQPVSGKQQLRNVKWLQESRGQHDDLPAGGDKHTTDN